MRILPNEKKETISIYVTKEEKEVLLQKAKEAGNLSLSAYAQKMIFQNQKERLGEIFSAGSFNQGELLDDMAERKCLVKAYLTEEEAQYVKKLAGNLPVSAFIRKTLLRANNGKFIFEVKTDDLEDIRRELSEFNLRMEGIIGALSYRSELYQSDITNMRRLLDEANENIKKSLSMAMTDRKYVRKKGVQHLEKQIDKLLSTAIEGGEGDDSDM